MNLINEMSAGVALGEAGKINAGATAIQGQAVAAPVAQENNVDDMQARLAALGM